jgi:S-adenosylmethionine hydrolase
MNILAFLTDFGHKEHFTGTMKGVALTVSPDIRLFDITHHIQPYNIWEAGLTLASTIHFWPRKTVFVCVTDPGVGTSRKSIVALTNDDKYIVTPDNGTLTFVIEQPGIQAIREINEQTNRRPGSEDIHTFHGRDIYAYTGARLASGIMSYEEVGNLMTSKPVRLQYQPAELNESGKLSGMVMKIEEPFGNLVTNIPQNLFFDFKKHISGSKYKTHILKDRSLKYDEQLPFVTSFGHVQTGQQILYPDSNGQLGVAANQAHFAKQYNIGFGNEWKIEISAD